MRVNLQLTWKLNCSMSESRGVLELVQHIHSTERTRPGFNIGASREEEEEEVGIHTITALLQDGVFVCCEIKDENE